MSRRMLFLGIVIMALTLAGCSGIQAEPAVIATYPRGSSSKYPSPPMAQYLIVYQAYMELRVADVDWAAEQAARWALDSGGYVLASQSWYQDENKLTSLQLAVPTVNFSNLRRNLLSLGELINEQVTSESELDMPGDGRMPYSQITVQLRPMSSRWTVWDIPAPAPQPGVWNPVYTFQRAFGVFWNIFGFVVDMFIWVVVVAGPFALIGWGLAALVRRGQRERRSVTGEREVLDDKRLDDKRLDDKRLDDKRLDDKRLDDKRAE